MKNDMKKTGTKTATAALAQINAEIEALKQQRIGLAEPLKIRFAELRTELAEMETEIRSLEQQLETRTDEAEGRDENCRGDFGPRFAHDRR